jgi:hypothetical protein
MARFILAARLGITSWCHQSIALLALAICSYASGVSAAAECCTLSMVWAISAVDRCPSTKRRANTEDLLGSIENRPSLDLDMSAPGLERAPKAHRFRRTARIRQLRPAPRIPPLRSRTRPSTPPRTPSTRCCCPQAKPRRAPRAATAIPRNGRAVQGLRPASPAGSRRAGQSDRGAPGCDGRGCA